ncbi:hypothetical protein E3N88_30667 [Mikania micrantha]|uniref:Uncharacterized protein n=1 Tax=Mikania micrantha TaxID=192012 RepID=A0A5N6MMR8_9ASTR|nr:hypothetical protein E3N88_30667 [Mikania micrantha]
MAATTLYSAPILPHQYSIFGSNKLFPSTSSTKSPIVFLRASSSTPTVDEQEKDEEEEKESLTEQPPQSINSIPIGGCKACGKTEMERGCNGEGRIQGGIATVPGFGWWPIKAYRPCPAFVSTGGRYRRQGQSMDEVAGFGTVPTKSAATAVTETRSR